PARAISLEHPVLNAVTGSQHLQQLHAVPIDLAQAFSGGRAGNQATLNFLTYVGGTGPDTVNALAIRNENGDNFIYVTGSFTDETGRTDIFAAKFTEGATSQVWGDLLVPDPAAGLQGPDIATGLALFGNSVYVA